MSQNDEVYRRIVHMYVVRGELSGPNVENLSFKGKGRLDNAPVYFVKQIIFDLHI